jgi:hypothetical protein
MHLLFEIPGEQIGSGRISLKNGLISFGFREIKDIVISRMII